MKNETAIRELTTIPGIGPAMARDLIDLGYRTVPDLKKANPETMYHKLTKMRGQHIDRCVLYVFRCAVYFARTPHPNPELLKWWNWKDK